MEALRNRMASLEQSSNAAVGGRRDTLHLCGSPVRKDAMWCRSRMSFTTMPAGAVLALAPRNEASGTAFQAMLVAAMRAVQRAVERVRAAESAAISLAQQQKVAAVADDLQASADDLRQHLDAQGHCILGEPRTLREKVREAGVRVQEAWATRNDKPTTSWWFALTEAVESLDAEADQLAELAAAQSAETPAGALGRDMVERFRSHHDALLDEAERWID